MDGNEDRFRALDLSGLRFPSDGLSIGFLRKVHSEMFDKGVGDEEDFQPRFFSSANHPDNAGNTIGNMLFCERLIAANAYAAARGVKGPEMYVVDLVQLKEELTEQYERYGIAEGEHEAAELIRDIERQGAALALKQAYPDCIFGRCRGRLRARSFSASCHRPRSLGSDFGLTFDNFFLG